MSEQGTSFDLAVMGGGIAGMIAANRAADGGLKVVVLEKGSEDLYLCNSRYTGGVFHVAFHSPMRPPEDLRRIIYDATAGAADPDLSEVIANTIAPVIRWLQGEGIRFVKAGPGEWQDYILSPPQYPRAGLHWPGRGGDVLLRTLEQRLVKRGGIVRRGARVIGLSHDLTDWALEIESAGTTPRLSAKAVVIADGGFQGDPQMLERLVTCDPSALRQRGAATGCGDGLRLASSLGAAIFSAGEFYGHVLSKSSLHNNMLWPYPWIDDLAGAGIAVDATARRFEDEGRGGVVLANAIARLENPGGAVAIFDDAIWNDVGTDMLIPANPLLEVHGCEIHHAMTIGELADSVGLDREALRDTVEGYNKAFDAGTLEALTPPRKQKRFKSRPLMKAPYRAIRLAAGITYTMGGIVIDGAGRVLDRAGKAIPGLYAAGATTGGLEGGEAVGYVGGLVKSAATGFVAGDQAASDIRQRIDAQG